MFLDFCKLKVVAELTSDVAQMIEFYIEQTENRMGNRENDGYQHSLLFPQCFQIPSFSGSFKLVIFKSRVL